MTVVEGDESIRIDPASTPATVTGPNGAPVDFTLKIPGVIRRQYRGTLTVSSVGNLLFPVVTMDREIAVGSITGAELPSSAVPVVALAVQAVAARSFLCAARAPRHPQAEFCDTTHCQFLRAPAVTGTKVDVAMQSTRNLVLAFGPLIVPAHYSASCGGQTDEANLDGYQYRSVLCEPCRRDHTPRRGHGLGLCQTGAVSLARSGWTWRQILAKYYPGCTIRTL
jgi:peptidoglycan hydrolase-like amidase